MMEILNLNYYEQEPEDSTFPDIMVDITHRCNMECNNCYIPTRTPPDMELAKFKEFIKRFPNRRMFRIVGAEPTLHKHCIDFIKTVLEEGHMCLLITNGLRLSSPSFVKKLQATGLKQIYMSMNGVDRDDWYETIDDLACAEKKLKAFKNIANKFNLDIGTIIVKGVNEEAPRRMLDLIEKYDVKNITMRIKNVGQLGRYMQDTTENYKMEDLVRICAGHFNLTEEYIWEFYKKEHTYTDGWNYWERESCGIEFPVDKNTDRSFRYKSRWVKLTNWSTDNEVGIPDPGSERRGRITPDWKIAPFMEHVRIGIENGSGY